MASAALLARSEMISFVDSLVAPFSLLNALIVAAGHRKDADIAQTFDRLEGIWNAQDALQDVPGAVAGDQGHVLKDQMEIEMEISGQKGAGPHAQNLGYDGYPAMQKALQEIVHSKLTSIQRIQASNGAPPNPAPAAPHGARPWRTCAGPAG